MADNQRQSEAALDERRCAQVGQRTAARAEALAGPPGMGMTGGKAPRTRAARCCRLWDYLSRQKCGADRPSLLGRRSPPAWACWAPT